MSANTSDMAQPSGNSTVFDVTDFVRGQVAAIREQVADGVAVCGLSGGVDSAVAAALVHRAIPGQLTCVYVDTGLMRAGETEQIEREFTMTFGRGLVVRREQERFLAALAGVVDPEAKRKTIGREFVRVFEEVIEAISWAKPERRRCLVQGTVAPDVVESGAVGAATIKSHHNVGGLPEDLGLQLVEPLRTLFKEQVREVGRALGLPAATVDRQPFPGPGLGIRVIGAVTAERLELVRQADAIVRGELAESDFADAIWQCPVVLLADVRSVGIGADGARTYGHPVVLRPITSTDAMTASWLPLPAALLSRITHRITSEVPGVNRVVLDLTPKPPATIEWE